MRWRPSPTSGSNFFFQAEDGIRYRDVTGVQTCALPISKARQITPYTEDDGFDIGELAWSPEDRKSTRLNSSHITTSYAVLCLKKKIPEIAALRFGRAVPGDGSAFAGSPKGGGLGGTDAR